MVKNGKWGFILEPIIYNKEKNVIRTSLNAEIILTRAFYFLFIFFGAKAPFMEGIYPFGTAIFAALYESFSPVSAALVVFLSYLLSGNKLSSLIICCGSILLFVIFKKKYSVKNIYISAALISVSFFLASFIPMLFEGIYFYDIAILLLACIGIFCIVLVLHDADINTFSPSAFFKSSPKIYVPILLLFASGLNSSGFFGKTLTILLCCFFTLSFSYKNGVAFGTVAGILSGIVCGFPTGDLAFYISLFSFSSLLAGIFSPYGKICTSLSYILGALLVTFYTPDTVFALSAVSLIIFPIIVFPFFPETYLSGLRIRPDISPSHAVPFSDNFSNYASVLQEISEIYREISERNISYSALTESDFFSNTASRLCENCPMQKRCWHNTPTTTYCSFFVLTSMVQKEESISPADIPLHLMNTCIKKNELINIFTASRQLYRQDRLWQMRMQEIRHSVSKQLLSISSALKQMSDNAQNEALFDHELESKIKKGLFLSKIPFRNVYARVLPECEINIFLCGKSADIARIEEIVSESTGISHTAISKTDTKLSLIPSPPYRLSCSFSQKNKSGNAVCGDCVSFSHVKDGKFAAILCDGMGSGEKAFENSRAAISMTTKMLENGFSPADTIEIVNSLLLLKSDEPSFSTVDLAVFNLHSGEVSIYKSGAACSFIKSGTHIKKICCDSLPAGTFSKADIYKSTHTLSKGDTFIMISDGALSPDIENNFLTLLSSQWENADILLNKILKLSSDNTKDDISVIVIDIDK